MRLGLLFFPGKWRQEETLPLEEADRRSFLEFAIVFVIICGLLALYVRQFTIGIEKAKLVEAFSLAQAPRVEAMVLHAVTGEWLQSGSTNKDNAKYVSSVRLSGGAVLVDVRSPKNAQQVLSFVPATPAEYPAAVVWLCGDAEPPPGMIRKAHSTTSVPGSVLPSTCRPRRYIDE